MSLAVSLMRRAPLWPRVVVSVSLCFLALLAIIGVLTLRAADQSRDRIFQERLVIGEMASQQIDGIFERAFAELERANASTSPRMPESDPADLSNELQQVLGDVHDDIWLGFYRFDSGGTVVASAPASQTATRSAAAALAAGAKSTDQARQVTSPYIDELTGRPAVLLLVSRRDPDSGTGFTLGGAMDLSGAELSASLSNATRLGNTGHAELFDGRGLVVASTDPAGFLTPGEHLHSYLRILSQKMPTVEAVPLEPRSQLEAAQEDHTHVMAVVPLSNIPWGVAIGGSESETLAPVTHLRNEMLLVGAISLGIMWILSLVGARLLVRPVRALTRAADGITAGDLDTPIHVGEGGEIGQLGQSLDGMRLRLRTSLKDVEQRDRELERRVAERTLEVQTLYAELQRKEDLRGRLLENVISAQEDERKRIARELHDETGQALTGIIMSLEVAEGALDREPTAVSQRLETAKTLANQSIAAIRRLVVDLRPAALDDLGLVPAIRAFAGMRLQEKGIRLEMRAAGFAKRMDPSVETCLFRVAQEAVTNIVRHSRAASARIDLRRGNGVVSLLVRDDGDGFNVDSIVNSSDPSRALGLAGMEERVSLLGGQLTVQSRPGRGTSVRASVPIQERSP